MINSVSGYRFDPSQLRVEGRPNGISAFLRTRNGEDFVEHTIRSHLPFYDEIVAVFNRCTDSTPQILERLQREFPEKIRVFHYLDPVAPPGSTEHAQLPGDHARSMVNYTNFALAQTRYRYVVKMDDDHLAIDSTVAEITRQIRAHGIPPRTLMAFSGLNLARDQAGQLGVLKADPISGNGDIAYFRIDPKTYFHWDRRFERFDRSGMTIRFSGFAYWHLKYLKAGQGFANYDLAEDPGSRFHSKYKRLSIHPQVFRGLSAEIRTGVAQGVLRAVFAPVSQKQRFLLHRDTSLRGWISLFADLQTAETKNPSIFRPRGLQHLITKN